MSGSASRPEFGGSTVGMPDMRDAARTVAGFWWLWLVTGVVWIVAALVLLQFDSASIATIGYLVGLMLLFAGAQQFVVAAVADSVRWLWALFGVLFLVAGVVCLFNPEKTFAGLADILGFVFLCIAVSWLVRSLAERESNPVWWLGLVGGVMMVVVAFWTSGQFFLERAYTLLVFAGIWAMLQGVTDIARAFMVRSLRDTL
jgi:uncharacterized membrane protein HdeD (DUF308 family)